MPPTQATGRALLVLASLLALFGAFKYAGSANDGGRFATAESLGERGSFIIDQSIFVQVPPGDGSPYKPNCPKLAGGTIDKAFIGGHFYSDKGPVLSMIMGGLWFLLHIATGWTAAAQPALFCKILTFATSGLGYTVAVWCVWQLFGRTPATCKQRLLITVLFALGTTALPYMRNVNNHIVLLGVAMPLFLGLDKLANNPRGWGPLDMLGLGCLAGFGYTLDQAAGPPLIAAGGLVLYRTGSLAAASLFAFGALPLMMVHHIVTYAVGGTIGPMAAVPEYFQWPGSPFDEANLTGLWGHHSFFGSFAYAGEMLVGRKHGFLLYNLPLLLVFPALNVLWRRRRDLTEGPEIVFALAWCAITVGIYTIGSTGFGGGCLSIRWFVPLLAAGFTIIAVALRYEPDLLGDMKILAGWSMVVGALMWYHGAWHDHAVPLLWLFQYLAVLHWTADRIGRARSAHRTPKPMFDADSVQAA